MNWQSSIFFGLFIISQLEGATHVGGVLFHNTVWENTDLANTYYLLRTVQIPKNVTLTILSGVKISFALGDFEILVKGTLNVVGSRENPVIFQGGSANHAKWMIKFQSTQLSLSSISHAHFIGPKKALQLVDVPDGIQENNGKLSIQSSIFSDNTAVGANGIYPRWSNPSVPALEFQSCTFNRATISSLDRDSEPITINNSQIYDSTFYPRASNEGIQINDCELGKITVLFDMVNSLNVFRLNNSTTKETLVKTKSNSAGFQFVVRQSTIESFVLSHDYVYPLAYLYFLQFEDSTISNVSLSALYYSGLYSGAGYIVNIRNCLYNGGTLDFTNILVPISVTIQSSHLRNVNIIQTDPRSTYTNLETRKLILRNSTFIDGRILFQNGQSDISYSTITLATPPLTLNGNSIITCSSIERSNSIEQTNTTGVSAKDLRMYKSTITNFSSGLQIALTTFYAVNISQSNFIGNSLYNIENKGPYNIFVSDIYWGTNNSETVTSKIIDYWDNINYGHVMLLNNALNPLPAEAGCSPYTESIDQLYTEMTYANIITVTSNAITD